MLEDVVTLILAEFVVEKLLFLKLGGGWWCFFRMITTSSAFSGSLFGKHKREIFSPFNVGKLDLVDNSLVLVRTSGTETLETDAFFEELTVVSS